MEGEDIAGIDFEGASSAECANTLGLMRQKRDMVQTMSLMVIVGSANNVVCKEDTEGKNQVPYLFWRSQRS